MSETKESKILLNESLVQEIVHGVNATLTSIVGLKPTAMPHMISNNHEIRGDVSGIIAVTQTTLNGTFVLSFQKETIFAILSKLYRKPFTEIDFSVRSGVGELTNMIYGVFKANLNKKGYALKMALPSVVIGEQHTVVHCAGTPALTIPFSTDFGGFTVSLIQAPEAYKKKAA